MLVLVVSLTAIAQHVSTEELLPIVIQKNVIPPPAAPGDLDAEFARWKAFSPAEKQTLVERLRTEIAPRLKKPAQDIQPPNISEYVNSHWKELAEMSASAGEENIVVRKGSERTAYPAKRIPIGSQ